MRTINPIHWIRGRYMNGFNDKFFHQKRVCAHRPGWKRMEKRRFTISPLNQDGLTGFVSLLQMDRVRTPLIKKIHGEPVTIAGDGYAWVQYFLEGRDYSAVATLDPNGKLVQWYVDVISRMGLDERGWPWYDDLYLDVVSVPRGWVEIIDGDDLNLALKNGAISGELYTQAWASAKRIARDLAVDNFQLSERVLEDRERLRLLPPDLQGNW